jgi:DNA-binding transcriptional MerR regulator
MAAEGRQSRFDDGKDADAMRTIGEVAAAFGIRQHVLRYWEQQFPMLRPLKRSGGRRYYRPEDVALVETIDQLINREGYTLRGARQAIEKGRRDPVRPELVEGPSFSASPGLEGQSGHSTSSGRAEVIDMLPKLRAIRERLAAALAT